MGVDNQVDDIGESDTDSEEDPPKKPQHEFDCGKEIFATLLGVAQQIPPTSSTTTPWARSASAQINKVTAEATINQFTVTSRSFNQIHATITIRSCPDGCNCQSFVPEHILNSSHEPPPRQSHQKVTFTSICNVELSTERMGYDAESITEAQAAPTSSSIPKKTDVHSPVIKTAIKMGKLLSNNKPEELSKYMSIMLAAGNLDSSKDGS